MKLVEVIWKDAEEYGEVGWNCIKDIKRQSKKPCPTMKSVGYVLFQNKNHVSIVSTIGDNESGTLHKIPCEFIISIRELK
jgi:hypothetical protein